MVTLTNYNSGELLIAADAGPSVRLGREEANRLILHARMHTVAEFVEKLPSFVPNQALVQLILEGFEKKSPTERWNLKEKFARLRTLAKGYEPADPAAVMETIQI